MGLLSPSLVGYSAVVALADDYITYGSSRPAKKVSMFDELRG
jgi:hypothetical protein